MGWTLSRLDIIPESDIGKRIMRGELIPNKLISNVAYPMRP
jgi:hypothetical protein